MSGHLPVMLNEVVETIAPRDGAIYIDGTFGGGGYSRALLDAAKCRVLAIDLDPDAIARGRELAKAYDGRLMLFHGPFSEMETALAEVGEETTDGVMLDLGVSSFQLDQAERGFSFAKDGPLDMRMAQSGESAADLVNNSDEQTLTDIIRRYGEERMARRVARAIIAARPFTRTAPLADVVSKALGPAAQREKIHPATRTFQGLRIAVNDELGELERGLAACERVLGNDGRLAVVAFHSLEDRIVKQFLLERSTQAPAASRHAPEAKRAHAASFRLLHTRSRTASDSEIEGNPRARSARLRAAVRIRVAA
jgi:16S rRNA (cytosine1402-N4)-methyltransferase